jgi:hypothetical protein
MMACTKHFMFGWPAGDGVDGSAAMASMMDCAIAS